MTVNCCAMHAHVHPGAAGNKSFRNEPEASGGISCRGSEPGSRAVATGDSSGRAGRSRRNDNWARVADEETTINQKLVCPPLV